MWGIWVIMERRGPKILGTIVVEQKRLVMGAKLSECEESAVGGLISFFGAVKNFFVRGGEFFLGRFKFLGVQFS